MPLPAINGANTFLVSVSAVMARTGQQDSNIRLVRILSGFASIKFSENNDEALNLPCSRLGTLKRNKTDIADVVTNLKPQITVRVALYNTNAVFVPRALALAREEPKR